MKSTRDAYGEALLVLGENNPLVVAIDADLASSTRTGWFGKRFPERFFNLGIAEQNVFSVAAGLATCGKIPFSSTFSVFATERALNQIRQCIAYPRTNVKIVVSHSGFSAAGDGGSHQTLIDIALMRSLPNMTVLAPADATQTQWAVKAAAAYEGPVYIRLSKTEVPIFFPPGASFHLGKAVPVREGSAVTILVTGNLLGQVIEAADHLQADGIEPDVLHLHTIKPLDKDAIVRSARKTGIVVAVEEHSIIGGLGGAVAELLAENHPVPVQRIGVQDVFGESGSLDELYDKHGLTTEKIVSRVKKVVHDKRTMSLRW